MNPLRRRWMHLAYGCALGAMVMLALSVFLGPFRYATVCTHCGMIRSTTEWQVPFTSITVFRQSTERATPLSTVLMNDGIVAQHDHDWLFCHGGGNGVLCALGRGRHIGSSVESEGVAAMIGTCNTYGELLMRDKILNALFDPDTSSAVKRMAVRFPLNGFSDASSLRDWMDQNREIFAEEIGARKK